MYDTALALVHAAAFSDTFRRGFDWMVDQLYDGFARPRLFDLGCGDGTWLDHARYFGVPGAGLDTSEAFVRLATSRKLAVTTGDANTPRIPSGTTAVTAIGEVLAYTPSALAGAVQAAAGALPASGLLLFDLPGPDTPESETITHGKDWTLTSEARIRGGHLTRAIRVDTPAGTHTETHRQQLFSPGEVCALLDTAGFLPELLDSYGPCPLLPGRFAIHARKLA
jgi:SAM-dependent methyltransferase